MTALHDVTLVAAMVPVRPIASGMTGRASAGVYEIDDQPVVWIRLGSATESSPIGATEAAVACRGIEVAAADGVPVVIEVAGASVAPADGISALHGWGTIARALTAVSGLVATVAVVDGPVVTGMALLLGLIDVVVMTEGAQAFVSSPAAVATTTGRTIDPEALGGLLMHRTTSGVAHLTAIDLDHAIAQVADLLSHLPSNNADGAPVMLTSDPSDRLCTTLASIVPDNARVGYDMRRVITEVVDDGELLELSGGFGQAMVCGLARLGGHPVGIVANQPAHLAGAIDIASSQKAARFVQWCDALGLPLVTLVDTPGYLPGRDLEWDGMIRHGGQLAFAYAAATVPRICVLIRKAYGGAYIVMDCKTMGNDLCVAWPRAEIAVMGASGAVQILQARRLAGLPTDEAAEVRSQLEDEYAERYLNPLEALSRGYVDEVIEPSDTRAVLTRALPSLLGKRTAPITRKHHNGPL